MIAAAPRAARRRRKSEQLALAAPAAVARSGGGAVAPPAPRPAAAGDLVEPPAAVARGATLGALLDDAWGELEAFGTASCPVCTGTMRRGGAAARCERCGSALA